MRRSTTSVATERTSLLLLLLVELLAAVAFVAQPTVRPVAAPPAVNTPAAALPSPPPVKSVTMPDGRTATVSTLGGARTADLAARIIAELGGATAAVTGFWGDDWPRTIDIVIAGTDEEFLALGGGGPDTAATTTSQRIVFAPGAAAMSDSALRIVLRHELFHYASRSETAADAPRWLTEGVADYVGRPSTPPLGPALAATLAVLPTDADLATPGPSRSLAYDRAWWFSRFVAERYGADALRRLYVAACAPGHAPVDSAIRDVLGADTSSVLAAWRTWLSG